jgi:cytochrome oxidase Cu insertion factor (SCO1/SenC/PrrC family)
MTEPGNKNRRGEKIERSEKTGLGAHDRRQRRILIGVALMFFAPLALSFYLYYGRDWHPGGRVNSGELIEPARPLPLLSLPLLSVDPGHTNPQFLKGKWTFLYVQRGRCDDECRTHLYDTRQVRLALDRDMNRVQRVFIGEGDCCDLKELRAAHPDLVAVRAGPADESLLALLPMREGAANSHRVYLIDPLGNLMMFYAADAKPKGMLEDMKRLLRLSSIG